MVGDNRDGEESNVIISYIKAGEREKRGDSQIATGTICTLGPSPDLLNRIAHLLCRTLDVQANQSLSDPIGVHIFTRKCCRIYLLHGIPI